MKEQSDIQNQYPWIIRHWELVFGFVFGIVSMNFLAYALTQSLLLLLLLILTAPGGMLLIAGMAVPVARHRLNEMFYQPSDNIKQG